MTQAHKANYPGVFREVAQLVGDEATALLIAQYGGCAPLYIPGKPRHDHPLCQLLGEKIAQQLAREFGGLTVEIPRAVAIQIEQRNRLIVADRAAGITQSELAKKYQLTARTIRKIVGPSHSSSPQATRNPQRKGVT